MIYTKLHGYDVAFPFQPYGIQKVYMSRLLQCLKNRQNGLLESPTGTGKTLAILCAAIAWLEKVQEELMEKQLKLQMGMQENMPTDLKALDGFQVEEIVKEIIDKSSIGEAKAAAWREIDVTPKIIYSSRTHAQLNQAMKELKRTNYTQHSAVILASRDQLCIHPDVSKLRTLSEKNFACRLKKKQHTCVFADGLEDKVNRLRTTVTDIEDLLDIGQTHQCCPYYASRLLNKKAEITFAPYNYLLDPNVRKAQNIDVNGAAIIFDEGHNIEQMCEDSASTALKSETLAVVIKELSKLLEILLKEEAQDDCIDIEMVEYYQSVRELTESGKISIQDIADMKTIFCNLEEQIDETQDAKFFKAGIKFPKMIWLEQVMMNIGINFEIATKLISKLDALMEHFQGIAGASNGPNSNRVGFFSEVSDFLKVIFPYNEDEDQTKNKLFSSDFLAKYRLAIQWEKDDNKKKAKTDGQWYFAKSDEDAKTWVLYLYCLSPSVGFKSLMKRNAHSIVITSGTLAPLMSFPNEMETEFQVQLENKHVISDDQLKVCMISSGESGVALNSVYKNRENVEYYRALGQTMIEYLRIIPDGVLLFFTSYAVKTKCFEQWERLKLFDKMKASKEFFEEPRGKGSFFESVEKYKEHLDENKKRGAVFVGICRGKLSEGLDLGNHYCRGVIIVGLPYASSMDTRIKLKREYLDLKKNTKLSASSWYELQMKRALNQAIGRVVRHKDDYGVVLLLDERFPRLIDGFSKWIRPYIVQKNYQTTREIVVKFFECHTDEKIPSPPPMAPIFNKVKPFINPSKSMFSKATTLTPLEDKTLLQEYKYDTKGSIKSENNMLVKIENEPMYNASKFKSENNMFVKIEKVENDLKYNPSKVKLEYVEYEDVKPKKQRVDENKTKIKVELRSVNEDEIIIEEDQKVKNITPSVLLKKIASELKAIFSDEKRNKLLSAIKKLINGEISAIPADDDYSERNFTAIVCDIFKVVPSPKRDQLLAELSTILKPEHRSFFIIQTNINKNYVSGGLLDFWI